LDDFLIDEESEKYEPNMKDLQDETINYVSASFFEMASTEDKLRFLGECWGQKVSQQSQIVRRAREIFATYGVLERCEAEINRQINDALSLLQGVPQPYRSLLTNWATNYERKEGTK
jgi:geranylgeranyl pyrophosphate synthase